jgi:hypothetical protein
MRWYPAWDAEQHDRFTVTPTDNGVDVAMTQTGWEQQVGPVGLSAQPVARFDGTVRFLSGGAGNALGVGCAGSDGIGFWFFLHDQHVWTFDDDGPSADGEVTLLVRHRSSAIRPTSDGNRVSLVCRTAPGEPSQFLLAVNGAPVANLTVGAPATGPWRPFIAMCSPDSVDTGRFTDFVESAPGP